MLYYKDPQSTPQETLSTSVIKTSPLKAYKAKGTVSSESHTEHITAM